MERLVTEHATHGRMAVHVLERVASELSVSTSTLERRYEEHLRLLECRTGMVRLTQQHKAVISDAPDLAAALQRFATLAPDAPIPLVERAVWRDAGDRALTALRQAEIAWRARSRTASCAICAREQVAT